MVPVRWVKPGSRHHNVVHYVHQDLVLRTDDTDRVTVLWPKKGKKGPEKWDAVIVQNPPSLSLSPNQKEGLGTRLNDATVPITIKSKLLYV